jgi:hypothetical protein
MVGSASEIEHRLDDQGVTPAGHSAVPFIRT